MKTTIDNLTSTTIKAHIKHFKLKIKNEFLYKGDIAIYTEPLDRESELLAFLEGLSIALDSKELWI